MRFEIFSWVSNVDSPGSGSILGIVDKDNPCPLPAISAQGYWSEFRSIDERQFKFAEDAKKAIALHGFYLMGQSETASK